VQHSQKYQTIARTIAVPGAPIGANGPAVLAYTSTYPKGVGATLWIENITPPVSPGVNSEVTASLNASAGFGASEFQRAQISPGSAVRFRFATQVNLTLQQIQTPGPGLARPATTVYLFTTFDDSNESAPPISSIMTAAPGVFTPTAPNIGFAPPYKPWIHIQASAPYDVEFRNSDGTLQAIYLNIVPGNAATSTFLLPMGCQINVRPNGGAPIQVLPTWTEKRNG